MSTAEPRKPTATKSTASKASAGATRSFKLKRAYEHPEKEDGLRILVDRLWPRGLTKAKADVDIWLKDAAPSDALRRLIHKDPTKWEEFVAGYARELEQEPGRTAVAALREHLRHGSVTLIYAAKNESHNNAVALKEWLERKN